MNNLFALLWYTNAQKVSSSGRSTLLRGNCMKLEDFRIEVAVLTRQELLINNLMPARIIAIMLGRLEMDIDECINTYTSMFKTLFGKTRLPVNFLGRIKGRFDSVVLEECVEDTFARRTFQRVQRFRHALHDSAGGH